MRFAVLALALVACSRSPAEPIAGPPPASAVSTGSSPPSTAATSATASPAGTTPLHWTDPAKWQRRPPATPLRSAQYVVPRAGGDDEDGECVVTTFGAKQGGSVEDNVKRWTGQFQGGPAAVRSTRVVHGMRVTRVEAGGTYAAMAMPGAAATPTVYPGWRLIGAIVEARSGLWFFKMTGPEATVKAAGPAFDQMIDSSQSD